MGTRLAGSTSRVIVDDVRPNYWPALPGWWRSGNVIVSYRVVGISESEQTKSLRSRNGFRQRQAVRHWSKPNNCRFTMSEQGYKSVHSRP